MCMDNKDNKYHIAMRYSHIGFFLICIILAFMHVGQILDDRLGTNDVYSAIFTVLGMAIGLGWGIISILKEIKKDQQNEDADKK